MTEGRRRQILRRGASLGYSGNNLGQLSARAEGIANGQVRGRFTARQVATARSIASSLSGSA